MECRCRNGHVLAELRPEYARLADVAARAGAGEQKVRWWPLDQMGVVCLSCRALVALGRDAQLLQVRTPSRSEFGRRRECERRRGAQIREAPRAYLAGAAARAQGESKPLPARREHNADGGLRMRCLACHRPSVMLLRAADGDGHAPKGCVCGEFAHYKTRNCRTLWC